MDRTDLLQELNIQKNVLKQQVNGQIDDKKLKLIRLLSFIIVLLLTILGIQILSLKQSSNRSLPGYSLLKILKFQLIIFLVRMIARKVLKLLQNNDYSKATLKKEE